MKEVRPNYKQCKRALVILLIFYSCEIIIQRQGRKKLGENPNKSSEEVGTDILSQSPHLMHDQRKGFMAKKNNNKIIK